MDRVERRKAKRVKINLKARWEGILEQQEGEIVDLSTAGCFILSAHQVKRGELIRIEIGESLIIWGEVIYEIEEMGFGLKFNATGEDKERLARLIEADKKAGKNEK
jgi:hypothetical protein